MQIHQETLGNGMTVLVVPRPGCRVVTTDLWMRIGSADETPEINGMAHFLEHMLFKGTERHGVGQIDRIIEGVGGYLNGGTSHDFTHYYISTAAENFATSIDILSEVAQHATLDPTELKHERQVVLEEYYRKQDQPYGLLWETLYDRMFETGPYKAPVLGTPDTLANINREVMRDFYEACYTPENTTLVIVGDLETGEAFASARRAFEDFARESRPPVNAAGVRTIYTQGIHEEITKDINETYGVLAFPAPALTDPGQAYALDVLQFVLGGGNASVLYQEIKEKRQLASNIHTGYSSSRHPDLFYVIYTCEEHNRAALEDAVLEQLDKVANSPLDKGPLDRARKLLVNEHAFSLETTSGQSSSIGYYFTVTGNTDFERNYAEGIRQVKAEQVTEQCRKWLRPDVVNTVAVRSA